MGLGTARNMWYTDMGTAGRKSMTSMQNNILRKPEADDCSVAGHRSSGQHPLERQAGIHFTRYSVTLSGFERLTGEYRNMEMTVP